MQIRQSVKDFVSAQIIVFSTPSSRLILIFNSTFHRDEVNVPTLSKPYNLLAVVANEANANRKRACIVEKSFRQYPEVFLQKRSYQKSLRA
jgi:hypothetical protein